MKNKIIKKNIEGIDVIYYKVPNLYTAYVGFHVLAGAYAENDENSGVAHYLEHMFFKGTKTLNWEDISREGTMLGGIQNASTGNYKVSYYIQGLPKDNFKGAVKLLSDMMFNSTLPADEIERERTVILEECKSYEDDHDSFFYNQLSNRFNTKQTRNNVIGTQESISNIDGSTLKRYYDENYGKDNTILLVVGSMSKKEVFATCKKYLKGNTLKDNVNPKIDPKVVEHVGKTEIIQREGIQQTYVAEYFNIKNPVEDAIVRQLMFHILGGGMNSILFRELRERRGLCYSIGIYDWMMNREGGSGTITSCIDPSKIDEFQKALADIKTDIIENGFSESDFEASKNAIFGAICRSMQSPEAMASAIIGHEIFNVKFDFDADYEKFKKLTLTDVNDYAKLFLSNLESSWLIMEPKKGGD